MGAHFEWSEDVTEVGRKMGAESFGSDGSGYAGVTKTTLDGLSNICLVPRLTLHLDTPFDPHGMSSHVFD